MKDEPVTIVDREVLKVLSADTRMDIMKMLSEGGRTPSFVAKKLKKSDSTIVGHLKALEKAGLVKKTTSPGKKWVFYSLTYRGEGIIASKSRRLVIILSTSLVFMMLGIGSFAGYIYSPFTFGAQRGDMLAEAESKVNETLDEEITTDTKDQSLLYLSMTMITISLAGIGFYAYKKSKIRGIGI